MLKLIIMESYNLDIFEIRKQYRRTMDHNITKFKSRTDCRLPQGVD